MGTIQDPEDFPALVLSAGSSTDLPDNEDAVDDQEMEVEQGRETPTDNFWSTYTGIWGESVAVCQRTSRGPPHYRIFSKKESFRLRPPKTAIIMYWVPALMKNSNNYKVKLKFHLFWFIKNVLFKVLIDSFQQILLKVNGSKDSNGREVGVYTEPGNPDVINNTILKVFGSIIDPADSPVLVRALRAARTEWKKHVHGRGEAVELIIVIVDSAVHGAFALCNRRRQRRWTGRTG